MTGLFVNVFELLFGLLGVVSPFILAMMALARRDRRHLSLSTTVLSLLNRPELRGLFTVTIRSSLFRGDSVSVEIWNCSRDQLWDVMEALSERLPDSARLAVNGLSTRRAREGWRLGMRGCPSGSLC
jgi:hypothetical protein